MQPLSSVANLYLNMQILSIYIYIYILFSSEL